MIKVGSTRPAKNIYVVLIGIVALVAERFAANRYVRWGSSDMVLCIPAPGFTILQKTLE